uniref:Homologous recombination OB-fold protein OB-fold domain-containing protein n=1 Tax=Tanacetum cinerariifolium TaxID=118510 RepID=A0A6L2MCW5_TANCI|nr:hypothetical protein [Tanacetum cinerariifolium]
MACSVSHTYDEIKSMVEKQIEEDKARQLVIMNLDVEYDNACGAKDDLRKAYEEYNHIPQETRALIDTFLKECATDYVHATGGIVTGCLGDIKNFMKIRKLEQVVAIVKSCSPNVIDDLTVPMEDLSSTIPGAIHNKVIGDRGYGKDITVGAAMILANVSVFTPKPSKHYLNIPMRNVVKVFRKNTVPGSRSGSG